MPISKSGGGFDPTKYTPIALENQMASVAYPAFVTALNVTGKGYLKSAAVTPTTATPAYLKITIDGVVKVLVQSASSVNTIAGLLQNYELYFGTSNPLFTRSVGTYNTANLSNSPLSYPSTGGSVGSIFIDDAIYFQNSLKVEVSTGDGAAVYYRIQGAYQ